ncbi:hypothetical protein ISE1_1312 [plant metagenome]|uniref:Uncharacterized protein n=1 Tax=plant metagenome TaxID=1297885 RepID=A0A484SQ80_9ZZZZ
MDPRAHASTQQQQSGSLYGFDMSRYVMSEEACQGSAHDVSIRALTHGGIYPLAHAWQVLALPDRAALTVFERHPSLQVQPQRPEGDALVLYVNTLGRLHARAADAPRVSYDENDRADDLGYVPLTAALRAEIGAEQARLQASEEAALAEVHAAVAELHANGDLPRVLEEVIDHVEHVESVCFYLGDRFYALMDRYANLIDDKRSRGFLSLLRDKPFEAWEADEVLSVGALHALFISGRSVRFEEFNGTLLSARRLLDRLAELAASYSAAGNEIEVSPDLGLFARAAAIREQTLRGIGKSWLRYRWIYGLNFQKVESILDRNESDEADDVWWQEFEQDYRALVGGPAGFIPAEHAGMAQLAQAAVALDASGVACERGSDAVTSWTEYLIERLVGSAVLATRADYGMSSSLRDISKLISYDEATLLANLHALTPPDFFTCFVSRDLIEGVGTAEAGVIASSVQKRMQFNRWHFIPGNLERPMILKSRHWYYPPLVPDIAVHADMHRAAHNRARVKFSIRSPGPDMSRPPLPIAGRYFRGFYDVRVVRMEGEEFDVSDILRVRRRTLWMESVYAALTQYLMSPRAVRLVTRGFQAGTYQDLIGDGAAQGGLTRPVALTALRGDGSDRLVVHG